MVQAQGEGITEVLEKEALANIKDTSTLQYRQPPYNIQAEQAVLGCILTNNESLNRVGDFLLTEHFYEPVHQRIYAAIVSLSERGLVATPVTLKNQFDKDEALKSLGGAEYLAHIAGIASTIINIKDYATLISDFAMRRELINVGTDVVNDAFNTSIDADAKTQIERAEQSLFTLASEGYSESGFQPLKSSVITALSQADAAYKRQDKISGIPTDFTDLDHYLGGLQNSDLIIVAARPSMGKTAFAINIAMNCCDALIQKATEEQNPTPPSVGFFSLEMAAEQLAARILAMKTKVSGGKMRTGSLNEEEFTSLTKGSKELYNIPFYIDDTPSLSISAVRTRARRLKRKHNLQLLLVDYLQLIRGVSKASEQNRVQEVSEITQGLKAIAKELNIPVIALSQLSRAVEQREDKRPQLSDLRESGSIEQDADIVMFLYREEYYLSRKMPPEGSEEFANWQANMEKCMNRTDIILAKHRNGPIGNVVLHFDSATTRFTNAIDDAYIPEIH